MNAIAEIKNSPHPTDLAGFVAELDLIRKEVGESGGATDVQHLKKIEFFGRFCTVVGWLTAPLFFLNPISIFGLSLGRFSRWTMVAHHVSHRAYDKLPTIPDRLTSSHFGRGKRRFLDWYDWIIPEAWHEEHDLKHHPRTGEEADPDLVERNLNYLRHSKVPMVLRFLLVPLMAATWRWVYYAPSTLYELHVSRARRAGNKEPLPPRTLAVWNPLRPFGRELWARCVLPYVSLNFIVLPLLFLPFGKTAALAALVNSLVAEIVTNLHTFAVIVPNHAGDDVYRFEERSRSREEHLWRQIIGSVNFRTGGDFNDFMHGWLNYQIEHHVWPELTMLQYRRAQPRVKAACEKFGVPYVQQSVFTRLGKLVDIMVGRKDMLRL